MRSPHNPIQPSDKTFGSPEQPKSPQLEYANPPEGPPEDNGPSDNESDDDILPPGNGGNPVGPPDGDDDPDSSDPGSNHSHHSQTLCRSPDLWEISKRVVFVKGMLGSLDGGTNCWMILAAGESGVHEGGVNVIHYRNHSGQIWHSTREVEGCVLQDLCWIILVIKYISEHSHIATSQTFSVLQTSWAITHSSSDNSNCCKSFLQSDVTFSIAFWYRKVKDSIL